MLILNQGHTVVVEGASTGTDGNNFGGETVEKNLSSQNFFATPKICHHTPKNMLSPYSQKTLPHHPR